MYPLQKKNFNKTESEQTSFTRFLCHPCKIPDSKYIDSYSKLGL